MNTLLSAPMFDEHMSLNELSLSDVEAAKNIFNGYVHKGTIKDCSFADKQWHMTSEYANYVMDFQMKKEDYDRNYKPLFKMPDDDFEQYLKTYLAFSFGRRVLGSLQYTLNDIRKILEVDPDDIISESNVPAVVSTERITEFFSLLPVPEESAEKVDLLLDAIEKEWERRNDAEPERRELATFDSYFLFRDIIDDFWANETDEDVKLFYAPIYFWWHITGVIPMRPREFLVTPRDCLQHKSDGYWLTIRKDLLKGNNKKGVGYKISEDFKTVTYKINDELGLELEKYIRDTSKYAATDLNTLFIPDLHYKHWKQRKHRNSRFYTYINLCCCLRYFYDEIICDRYGLEVVERSGSDRHLEPGTINYIYPGDTRHLSLINVVLEGGTPTVAMVLAGHTNAEMESWYSTNLTKYVECSTYREYRKVIKGKVEFALSTSKKQPAGKIFTELDNGGRCYSRGYIKGDYSDCLKAIGPNGEIACCPVCEHYSKNKEKTYIDDYKFYKQRVTDECTYIGEIVKQYRKGKGEKEDVLRACMQLKDTLLSYKQFCQERALEGGDEDASQKED